MIFVHKTINKASWTSPERFFLSWSNLTEGLSPREFGTVVTCDDAAVLPAITIDLSKANYQEVTPVYSTDINNHIN